MLGERSRAPITLGDHPYSGWCLWCRRRIDENEPPVGPETEQRAGSGADNLRGEVIGERRLKDARPEAAQHVMADTQAGQAYAEADRVEEEIEQVFPAQPGALAVPPRPEPVADEGQGRRDHGGDRLRDQR